MEELSNLIYQIRMRSSNSELLENTRNAKLQICNKDYSAFQRERSRREFGKSLERKKRMNMPPDV